MANHVSFYVNFHEINDAAKARWKEMTENLVQENYEYWFGDLWVDGKEGSPTKDEVRKYDWTTDVIGPKWCYIQDFDEDSFGGYSAWSPPEDGLVKILEELEKFDPNIITSITYDDEMPNFVGWYVYSGSQMEDGCEDDDEEIREAVFDQNPHLREHWDDANDEWQCDEDGDMTEEAYAAEDEYRDCMYEVINEMQATGIDDCIKFIKEAREEQPAQD